MDKKWEQRLEELSQIETVDEYNGYLDKLSRLMEQEGYSVSVLQNIGARGAVIENRFSDESTLESLRKSKRQLILYLKELLLEEEKDGTVLLNYLRHFYMFAELLKNQQPDKRASLSYIDLQKIRINNEFDLQYLLYAVLRPLYPDLRREVSENSGISTVRGDFFIPSLDTVIETKCTRPGMSQKKLIEEVEADILHYQAKQIFFYIYDKGKIVADRTNFETHFTRRFDHKRIVTIVQQSVEL